MMKYPFFPFSLAMLALLAILSGCSDDDGSSWNYYGSSGGQAGAGGDAGGGGTAGQAATGGSSGTGGIESPDASMPDASESDALVPWIRILSPSQGDTVENPVTVTFEGGGGVTHVRIEADNWPLHSDPVALGEGSITYEFTGVGFERTLLATGLDASGTAVATDQLSFTPVNPKSTVVFPIDLNKPGLTLSHFDSPQSTGSFGAARSGGRLHAGCDLYWTNDGGYAYQTSYYQYNDNTPIYAVADGTITGYSPFYQGTNALVVDHVDFVIRYGEVDDGGLPGGLQVGSKVTAGQLIAYMGDLDMSSGTWSMLHFELFSGDLTGSLTNTSNTSYLHVPNGNYQRRGDLMDCGPFLLGIMNP